MTETISGSARKAARQNAVPGQSDPAQKSDAAQKQSNNPSNGGDAMNATPRGLRIERVFTKPGVHPYDEIEWERRDVVMTNWRDGSVNFEQKGVEFPASWSVNAANIVTTKYFRGAQGTDQREWSLRQVIDRVVKKYRAAGEEYGYFATPEDAEIFEHELTYALAHQIFAFNSPVWFNVGTKSPQQVSACQPWDALVTTAAGLVPIGRLVEQNAVGTKVYDAHGLTTVLATKHNGVKEVLRVTTTSGHVLDVTRDHLVWLHTGQGSGRFVEAGTLKAGDQLSWHRRLVESEADLTELAMAEAALAGWLQSDGFVGQDSTGADRSLTIEAMTVDEAELDWVTRALDQVFPDVHRYEREVETVAGTLECRRTRLHGEGLADFVERWGLRTRGADMVVPPQLFTASLPVVSSYLRSVFQAEGFVSAGAGSAVVEVDMVSKELIQGMQRLLARFGIFAHVGQERPHRPDQQTIWTLRIQNAGNRELFAGHIGFVAPEKAQRLEQSLDVPSRDALESDALESNALEIASIESRGEMDVYDIQTESGEYLSDSLRVHNCFILAVDDTMDSILNWYREEGLIFKGGSGAGLNLSRIRSSKELLSSGGNASGPVSFMRGADASAGTIKSGGATRRAAKMVVLDVDHPDVQEFIWTKAREEDKIRVLRDAGFDMDLGGADITSVQYQNANNSVRVNAEFMRAVENGGTFDLVARDAERTRIDTVDARDLFHQLAQAAWECADPGIQYDDVINAWHTNPNTDRINASNPCSEYMSLDNSSCNLASLNLMKFLRADTASDGQASGAGFDSETFAKVVELVITAMDISISFADFPTESIARTTRDYRQLGIGYANLGALLMATGHAYDSDGGRAIAAAITALMTGTAYKRSAELAGVVGPYAGYALNAEPHTAVMRKHAAAADAVHTLEKFDADILDAAKRAWREGIEIGLVNGWRNAQASLLAPTGTIGFMMDVDTTGVEPDLALVKFKKLVGGGSMQIVNNTVPRALKRLGYHEEQIEAIVEYIAEHGHVVDAPSLKHAHYEVFDCAMGDRSIAPMGHVKMMAAVQPHLSGAISKTVNMPETATVEDVEELYFQGWKLGLKALAIYRNNCKVGQPLQDSKGAKRAAEAKASAAAAQQQMQAQQAQAQTQPAAVPEQAAAEHRPVRKRLPKNRPGHTTSFSVGGAEGYMIANSYPDDGLGEVFLKMSKQGSTLAGMMDAFSIAISVGLQYGVPLETYVSKFTNMRFEPAGLTDDPDVRMAQSILDYIFRRLALDHLPFEVRADYGIYSATERRRQIETGSYLPDDADEADLTEIAQSAPIEERAPKPEAKSPTTTTSASTSAEATPTATPTVTGSAGARRAPLGVGSSIEVLESKFGHAADAPLCLNCGTKMRPAGSCYACEGCGSTSGCS
jgi:ribonucleoside-diphosphate reductase alpha chain